MGFSLLVCTLLAAAASPCRPPLTGATGHAVPSSVRTGVATLSRLPGVHPATPADSAHVELVRAPKKLLIGQRIRLRARVVNADGSVRADAPIAWRARASSYVSLAADGRITGVRPGRVGIVAVSGDMIAETTIEVLDADLGSFTLKPPYAVTRVGDTVHVALDVRDAKGRPITGLMAEWSLSPEGASIDDGGAFAPKMAGLYTILATLGDRKAVATVRVAPRAR